MPDQPTSARKPANEVRTETLCWAIPSSLRFERTELSVGNARQLLLCHLYYHLYELLGEGAGRRCQFAVKLAKDTNGVQALFRPEDPFTMKLFMPFRIQFNLLD